MPAPSETENHWSWVPGAGFEYAHETTAKAKSRPNGAHTKAGSKKSCTTRITSATKEINRSRSRNTSTTQRAAARRVEPAGVARVEDDLRLRRGRPRDGAQPRGAGAVAAALRHDATDANTGRLLSAIRPAAGNTDRPESRGRTGPPEVTNQSPTLSAVPSRRSGKDQRVERRQHGTATPESIQLPVGAMQPGSTTNATVIPGAVNQSYYPVTPTKPRPSGAGESVQPRRIRDGLDDAAVLVHQGTPNSPSPEPPSVGSSSVWTLDYGVPVSRRASRC